MATGTAPSSPAAPPPVPHPYAEQIEDHVRRTQGYLRSCDIAGAVITIAVFVLGYLMAMAIIDHWLWTGGLGKAGRTVACLAMLALVSVYAWRSLLPHLLRRINPIYAADRLEHAQPSLMNCLINVLLLHSQDKYVPAAVMHGLERQAAAGIEHLPAEAAVDRTKLLRIAYLMVGMVLLVGLYAVFSPKNLFPSVARILIPWADIPPVTRVRITTVTPGTADVYRGDPATVTAELKGLRDEEPVTLRYASLDGQAENQSVPMYRDAGQSSFSCQLPPDTAGMQRDLVYHIEAGDAPKKEYRLTVIPAPTIQIENIEYRYPPYTGMAPLVVERQGDIKGLEGTRVIIRAKASQPMGSAAVELAGIKDASLPMDSRDLAARAELPLKLVTIEGQREPQFTSYKLAVTDERGHRNREPAAYRIAVIPDQPPQVDISEPKERDTELAADKQMTIEVRARDADFALSDVRLLATRKGEKLLDESLVAGQKVRLDRPVRLAWLFVPAKHKLKPGDEVVLRAVAIDNKSPGPNRQRSPEYRIQIIAPDVPHAPKQEDIKRDGMQPGEGTDQKRDQRDPSSGKTPGEQGNAGDQLTQKDPEKKQSGEDAPKPEGQKEQGAGNKKDGQSGERGAAGKEGMDKTASKSDEAQGEDGSQQGGKGASGTKADGAQDSSQESEANRDPVDDPEAIQQIVDHLDKKNKEGQQVKQQPGNSGDQKADDKKQLASNDQQQPKQDSQEDSKEGSKPDSKQDQQENKEQGNGQQPGTKPQDEQSGSKQQGSENGSKQENQKQEGGNQSGGKQDGKEQSPSQGSQKEQGGQQSGGQQQGGGGGQSKEQGKEGEGSQGNTAGSGENQTAGGNQTGSSSAESKGQSGNSSSESKQSAGQEPTNTAQKQADSKQQPTDRKSNQQGNPSGKPENGTGSSDAKKSDRSADQLTQNKPGQKDAGTPPSDDKSASAKPQPGDKTQGTGKTADPKNADKPSGDKPQVDKSSAPQDGNKPESGDQVASGDPKNQAPGQASKQGQKKEGEKQEGENQAGDSGSSETKSGDKPEGSKPEGMNLQGRDPQSQPDKQPNPTSGGKSESGGRQGQQQKEGNRSEGNRPSDEAKANAQKEGESSNNSASGSPQKQPQDKSRAPNNTPGHKEQAPSDSKSNDEDSPNKPNQRPSSTNSGQGGERAGKGPEGPGQQGSGAGKGSAGQNQAGDDGGNRSDQSGPGDMSQRAGKEQQSDRATGQVGQQPGDARTGRPDEPPQRGATKPTADRGKPGEPDPNAPEGTQQGEGTPTSGDPAGSPNGANAKPGEGQSGPSSYQGGGQVVPGSDKANLDYAKRATDLTLSYLQDQLAKGKVDDSLRKRLGWSEEEFQSLLKRMQNMRDRGTDAKARPEDRLAYEQWLKSLGLRPSSGPLRTGKVEAKPLDNSRDDTPANVPRDLREQHEAFRRGLLEK